MKDWIARHRGVSILIAALAIAIGGYLVFYYFGFQTALVNDEVNEALPTATAPASPSVAQDEDASGHEGQRPEEEPTGPETVASGRFQGIEHETSGEALVLLLPDDSQVVRLEDLSTLNGPDLKVYLSAASADGSADRFDDDYVSLGPLKGNRGDQNYAVPGNVSATDYRSVVIWCERFSVGFGVAPLDRV